jgi:SAM-dependent methyltransferase
MPVETLRDSTGGASQSIKNGSRMTKTVIDAAAVSSTVPSDVSRVSDELETAFGGIDIYLFDQLLRGRFDRRRRVLDAGCGAGRNLPYFLRRGFDVRAVDADPVAIRSVQQLVTSLNPALPLSQIHCGPLDSLPWEDGSTDAVICSAVLHFARNEHEFAAMLREMWRVLAPGGLFFARLATSIGIERHLSSATGRVRLPDGSDRFVVDERTILAWTSDLGGRLVDPIKTTNVQNQRCMTTWVMEKPS